MAAIKVAVTVACVGAASDGVDMAETVMLKRNNSALLQCSIPRWNVSAAARLLRHH
ncbi:hypothetical protein SynA15127_02845 [Synechococcus sp. A15-127]|nr:hypothetical protein SynA15127_02845 [Synechococcus sp. A15-127]